MVEQVQGNNTIKLPNALTLSELLAEGKTPEQAQEIMHKRVFGADYVRDKNGKPVEQGKGSAKQPTPQHQEALRLAEDRKMMKNGGATADVIAQAVAAGVKAGLAAAKDESEL